MARSDLLISLVKAGSTGDREAFRKTVEALVAEERAKRHGILADRLQKELQTNGNGATRPLSSSILGDLFFELMPKRRIQDLVLPKNVSTSVAELVEEHRRRDLLRSHGLEPRNRILLAGDPGNGKTSLAEAIAESLMVPLVVARYDGLIASYLGETASRLRRLFDYVRSRHCVLFFDEFDTLGKERGDDHETGEIKRVVSSLLLQIDDLPCHVVVVTATNHPELLDRAVWRRFQLRLELPPPTSSQVEEYFKLVSASLSFPLGLTPKALAQKLRGISFSELEGFIADVARRYVLSLPDADSTRIANERLSQWSTRYSPPNKN